MSPSGAKRALNVRVEDIEPIRELGRGGSGVVWLVKHRPSGTEVAVKFLRNSKDTRSQRYRFEQEIRTTAKLHHPSILPVLGYGAVPENQDFGHVVVEKGRLWSAFEYLPEGSLADLQQPFEGPQLAALLAGVLDALAHCHARGLAHLDLKPANILVRDRQRPSVVLADFGITRAFGPLEGVTGTPLYMAPEQFLGRTVDSRTDLYALGCTVYQLVMGAPPFVGSIDQLRRAHVTAPFPLLGRPALDAWIAGLVAKSPSDRYPSAAAALAALPDLEPATHPSELAIPGVGFQPVPDTWRAAPHVLHHAATMALGSLGLRSSPVLGRGDAQDELWRAFQTVHRERRAVLLTLGGPRGAGTTRLLTWLGERVRELDCGQVFDRLVTGIPLGPTRVCTLDLPTQAQLEDARTHVRFQASLPLLVVCTVRDQPSDIELGPLSPERGLALVEAVMAVDADDALELHARCSGLPGRMVRELQLVVTEGMVTTGPTGLSLQPRGAEGSLTSSEAEIVQLLTWFEPMEAEQVLQVVEDVDALSGLVQRGYLSDHKGLQRTPTCPAVSIDDPRALAKRTEMIADSARDALLCAAIAQDQGRVITLLEECMASSISLREVLVDPVRRALHGLPPDHGAWLVLAVAVAREAMLHGIMTKVIGITTSALDASPNTHRVSAGLLLTYRAEASLRMDGDIDGARSDLDLAETYLAGAASPHRMRVPLVRAVLAYQLREFEAGLQALSDARAWADDPYALYLNRKWEKMLLAMSQRTLEALQVSAEIRAAFPDRHDHRIVDALVLLQMGEAERARSIGIEVLAALGAEEHNPRKTMATVLALIHLHLDDLEAAAEYAFSPDTEHTAGLRHGVQLALMAHVPDTPFEAMLRAFRASSHFPGNREWEVFCLDHATRRASQAGLRDRATLLGHETQALVALLTPEERSRRMKIL